MQTYGTHRRRSHRRRLQRLAVILLGTAVLGSAGIFFLISKAADHLAARRIQRAAPATSQNGTPERKHLRPVYPYSILKGGAYDPQELRARLASDPVAARHYAPFDLAHAQAIFNPAAKLVYVSYRKGSKIYWTRKRVRLPAGERLLTDGKLIARARCGNRVSDDPQEPVADDVEPDPTEEVMELATNWTSPYWVPQPAPSVPDPIVESIGLPPAPPLPVPQGPPEVSGVTPIYTLPPVEEVPLVPFAPPVAVVPEPNAGVLFGTALLIFFAIRHWRQRKSA